MRIIVNADDLGCTREVNEMVFHLASERRLTSFTVIANAPYVEEAVRFARMFPRCSVGVHLNISDFEPLRPTPELQPLLEGRRFAQRARNVRMTSRLLRAVCIEWMAQIDRLKALGVEPTHLDSHFHVHTIPQLFLIIQHLQRVYRIRRIRTTMNLYPKNQGPSTTLLLKKMLYQAFLRYGCSAITTDGFTDFLTFYERAQKERLPYRSFEVAVHPGANGMEKETEVLRSSWEGHLVFPSKLISFRELD